MSKHPKLKNSALKRKSISEFKVSEKTPIIIVLDNIRSLNNIGAVFRSSDAFLIEKIYLCGITAQPPHRDIHKTALGATDSVDWEYQESTLDLVKELQDQHIKVFAIEQAVDALFLQDFSPNKNQKYALVFGNEVAGVTQEVIDQCNGVIEIPQLGTKHSLNIAVSTGVVLWDVFSKIQKLG